MYKTKVFGQQTDTVVIETEGKHIHELFAEDAIVKLWFSDGTVLGLKYGKHSELWPNMWKIRVLNKGTAHWAFRQIYNPTPEEYSDEYILEADLVNFKVIPRTHYSGDEMNDDMV